VYLKYINFWLNQSKIYVAKCGMKSCRIIFDILKNFNVLHYQIKSSLNNVIMELKFY